MESEERPAKMRKLGHSGDDPAVMAPDTSPSDPILEEHPASNSPNENSAEFAEPKSEKDLEDENAAPKLSKNQLKKLKRHERWEAGREDRKQKRKEKLKEKKERRREEWAQVNKDENGNPINPPRPAKIPRHSPGNGTQVPVTVIFDCDFEDLMFDVELKSLGLQITRCYSDNRKARFRTHLALSSFGGKMKERFDGILAKQYTNWKGFQFFEEDFVAVAKKSKEWMAGPNGGEIAGAIHDEEKQDKPEEAKEAAAEGDIVYLSSESDNVLTHLEPYCTYIIGGLVDKNRHKGICHKRAVNRGIKTAKLPIGQFLEMNSRSVLVTNHVLEIMLKWMEFGDWGKAFMEVLPKRKGGKLREGSENGDNDVDEAEVEEADDLTEDKSDTSKQPTDINGEA